MDYSFAYILLLIYIVVATLGFINITFGPILWDFKRILASKNQGKIKSTRIRKKISVIIPTHNDAQEIPRFITQFVRGPYKKFELLFIDDSSSDDTIDVIKYYISKYPKQNIHLAKKLGTSSWSSSLSYVSKKYVTGDLVLLLSSKHAINDRLLLTLSNEFIEDTELQQIQLTKNIQNEAKVTSILQTFMSLSDKQHRVINLSHTTPSAKLTLGVVYTQQHFNQKFVSKAKNSMYPAKKFQFKSVSQCKNLAYTMPALGLGDFVKTIYYEKITLLSLIRKPSPNDPKKKFGVISDMRSLLLLKQPVIYVYLLLFGHYMNSPVLYTVGLVATSLTLGFVVLSTYSGSSLDKAVLLMMLPIAYVLFVLLALIELTTTIIASAAILYKIWLQTVNGTKPFLKTQTKF